MRNQNETKNYISDIFTSLVLIFLFRLTEIGNAELSASMQDIWQFNKTYNIKMQPFTLMDITVMLRRSRDTKDDKYEM